MIKAGIQNSINEHQEKLDNRRDSYCKLKYQEKQLLTQCQDTKDAPICKDGYTYFKLPDMHQSDPEGHTLTEELLAFDYKPTLAAFGFGFGFGFVFGFSLTHLFLYYQHHLSESNLFH